MVSVICLNRMPKTRHLPTFLRRAFLSTTLGSNVGSMISGNRRIPRASVVRRRVNEECIYLRRVGRRHTVGHDVRKIIEAALRGTPDQVAYEWHPSLENSAASRYPASSPQLLAWMDQWNEGKPYEAQVRPFGFLTVFTARTGMFAECDRGRIVDPSRPGRPLKD